MKKGNITMVSFAGSLPKGDKNGLEHHSRALVDALTSGKKFFVVGVVGTDGLKMGKDLVPVPTAKFERVEMISLGSDLEQAATRLLEAATGERIGGVGQQRFDMPAEEPTADAEYEVLELVDGPGYHFRIVDTAPGFFELRLCTQHVEGVVIRSGLPREELGEVAPGDYREFELELAGASAALIDLAARLIREWESNSGGSVVDAEVVDEDEEVSS